MRLPMPGRCRAAAGIACALSLEARSRRDCWEDMADGMADANGEWQKMPHRWATAQESCYCVCLRSPRCGASIVALGGSFGRKARQLLREGTVNESRAEALGH